MPATRDFVISNLLRRLPVAPVVDPKGENAERTWKAREAEGQTVRVINPIRFAKEKSPFLK